MASKWFGSILALAGAAGVALAQSPTAGGPPAADVKPVPAVAAPGPAGGCSTCSGGVERSGAVGDYREGVSDNILFARAEYLLWFYKNSHPRILAGTVPTNVVANNPNNTFPVDSIIPLVGGTPGISYDRQSGVRLGVGYWLDPDRFGLDAEGFWMERGAFHANLVSNGDPVIGPVFNDGTRETIILLSTPNQRGATVNVDANTRLWGAELNASGRLCSFMSDRLDGFIGFRYLSFDESVNVSGTSTIVPQNTNPGLDFSYFDTFGVHNQFYGAQIGLQSDFACGRWFLNLKGKMAIGDMHETARVDGSTTVLAHGILPPLPAGVPPLPFTLPGGVLAQPTNIGHFSRDRFAFVPVARADAFDLDVGPILLD